MSIHPSLSSSDKTKKQRSVLKRIERLKLMAEKDSWKEGDPVFGLPKIKTIRIKIKKEKVEKAETATTAEGTAPVAGAPVKEASPKAAPPAKGGEKK